MIRITFTVVLLLGLCLCSIQVSGGVPHSCMKIYDEGGADGVLRSEECSRWSHVAKFGPDQHDNCQFNTTKGRRRYQEDRITCNLDLKIPLEGNYSSNNEVTLGVLAVFDGHIGVHASAMASRLFMDYFKLHTLFGIYKERASTINENGMVVDESFNKSKIMAIAKNALTRTIYDIDNSFSKKALEYNFYAGTTAVTTILFDDHILVANVGDSKAFLCSKKMNSSKGDVTLHTIELTRDHTANIPEERARIERAGGIVTQSSFGSLINGHFPMTRAIGDVPLKRVGIIPDPELTDWRILIKRDHYLVVSSDGIFESLSPDDVCSLLQDKCAVDLEQSPPECIVRIAFERKSTDNLSVIVVPLNEIRNTYQVSSKNNEL